MQLLLFCQNWLSMHAGRSIQQVPQSGAYSKLAYIAMHALAALFE